MQTTKTALSEINASQHTEKNRLGGVNTLAASRRAAGNIDSVIEDRVIRKISQYMKGMDPVAMLSGNIDSMLTRRKQFRKQYKKYVLPSLDSMKQYSGKYNDRLKTYMMIEDALNTSTYQLFDLAAFFASGKYNIPENKIALAEASFAPIIDSMFAFARKYNIPSTASLVIIGFADGAGFSDDGPLIDTLTALIGNKAATKEELNKKLSELRANELIVHLSKVYDQKAATSTQGIKPGVEYISQGKGEAYPFASIKDYTIDDPRRRIVLCYWAVLPD